MPVDEIVQSLPDDQAELARETHAWLVKHGGVNYGCPDGADLRAGDALKAERAAAAANEKDGPGAEKGSKKAPSDDVSDDRIIERTVIFLRGADMNSTTERQIRAAVEADLDRDNYMTAGQAKAYGLVDEVVDRPLVHLGDGLGGDDGDHLFAAATANGRLLRLDQGVDHAE